MKQIAIKKLEITINQIDVLTPHYKKSYKDYAKNLPTPSLSNPLGKYMAQHVTADQLANTNHTSMEHVSLSDIAIQSKYLTISIARSNYTLINYKEVSEFYISVGSWNSCKKLNIYYGQNTNDVISVNPSRTTRIIIPQITSLKVGT